MADPRNPTASSDANHSGRNRRKIVTVHLTLQRDLDPIIPPPRRRRPPSSYHPAASNDGRRHVLTVHLDSYAEQHSGVDSSVTPIPNHVGGSRIRKRALDSSDGRRSGLGDEDGPAKRTRRAVAEPALTLRTESNPAGDGQGNAAGQSAAHGAEPLVQPGAREGWWCAPIETQAMGQFANFFHSPYDGTLEPLARKRAAAGPAEAAGEAQSAEAQRAEDAREQAEREANEKKKAKDAEKKALEEELGVKIYDDLEPDILTGELNPPGFFEESEEVPGDTDLMRELAEHRAKHKDSSGWTP
ncbi:hypothetical protein B0J12DRAFT_704332 [Macrophomina phaseolina]|uniref:Uncharacterized protein n=1 Tax=Macrophomina phaseolina TaxID=35725 RepID=A0ABQ8FVJ1_9PEZI|nr:hypothetical protein B0J12DRAFT_704332 [Macrophomina phaseolina]